MFKVSRKTLRKYSHVRGKLDNLSQIYCWAFISRLPCSNMKLIDAIKELVQKFWHENTRTSSNQKDVLKLRKGSKYHQPHIKHFLDMTQTKFYEIFNNEHRKLNLFQRSFEKCKPWFDRICTDCNKCCCKYHVEFDYFYICTHKSCFAS